MTDSRFAMGPDREGLLIGLAIVALAPLVLRRHISTYSPVSLTKNFCVSSPIGCCNSSSGSSWTRKIPTGSREYLPA